MRSLLLSLVVTATVVGPGCSSNPAPAVSTPGTAAPASSGAPKVAGPPGSIGIACRAISGGARDYDTSTFVSNLDVCSVGGDGMLTLAVKGEGANGVSLHLGGYHGAGSYPLSGNSDFTLANSIPGHGTSQSTRGCSASRCSAEVIDESAGAAAGTPHTLKFAVTCAQLCDVDSHVCTASPADGGAVTWSFRASDCRVR